MPDADRVLIIVRGWIEKAENDLKAAIYTLGMDEDCPADVVCFHAQQCVEKYLKAYLSWSGTDFPKTHDVAELAMLMPPHARPTLTAEEARRLTVYATVTRYPGNYEPIPLTEARRAIAVARRARREIRKVLPKEALRRR